MTRGNPETVEMFDEIAESVRQAFDKDGSVKCMLIGETDDGERITFETAGAVGNRAVAVKTLRQLFRRSKIARYVRVTQCWTSPVVASVDQSNNSNCGESIVVLAVDGSSVRMCSIAEIERGADGKVILGPWEPIEVSGDRRSCLIKVRHSGRSDGA
jgi:hypothetical protein